MERQLAMWLVHNLREQCELLEIMLLYYRNVDIEASGLLTLISKFKVTQPRLNVVPLVVLYVNRQACLSIVCESSFI